MADQGGLGESGKDGMTRLSLAFWWLGGSGSEILSFLKSTDGEPVGAMNQVSNHVMVSSPYTHS